MFLKPIFFVSKLIQNLIFPNVCLHCRNTLNNERESLCIACSSDLEFTDFHTIKDNVAYTKMLHFTDVYAGGCLLFFEKGQVAQSLIHELKYHGNQEIGIYLGQLIGNTIFSQEIYQEIDQIIAVPLHPKKQKSRGYNQAETIANGVAEKLGIAVTNHVLIRTKYTETQTKKNATERKENVKDVFAIQQPHLLSQKHILVIDDVLTTGATLSRCIETIQQHTTAKISFYCVALAL